MKVTIEAVYRFAQLAVSFTGQELGISLHIGAKCLFLSSL
jgi:hypothetical protein